MADYSPILKSMYDAAKVRSWVVVPPGDYDLQTSCVLEGKPVILDLRGVTFHVRAELSGPAIGVGFADKAGGNNQNYGWTVYGGRVRWKDDGGTDYGVNKTIGFRFRNVRRGRFTGQATDGMGCGIEIVGDGAGCSGNVFEPEHIRNGYTGLWDHALNGGFSTYHRVTGGWWAQGSKPDYTAHLRLEPGENSGGTVFRECYLQGRTGAECTAIKVIAGGYYFFRDCGFESDDHKPMGANFEEGSYRCRLDGYTCNDFVVNDLGKGNDLERPLR